MLENQILDATEKNELPVLSGVSPYPIVKKYAVILFLLSVALTFATILFDLVAHRLLSLVLHLPYLVIFYFCLKEHKENDLQGYLPFSRAVRISWLTGLFCAIPSAIFLYIFYQYLAPNALEHLIETVRMTMEAQPNADPDMVDTVVEMQKKWFFNPKAMALISIISTPIMYLLYGMAVGSGLQKPIPRFR